MREGWKLAKLGEVLDIQNGYAFDSKKFSNDGNMPLIRIRDIKAGAGTATRYSGEYDAKYVVRAGNLLVGMDGEFACHEWKGSDALLNQRVCRLQNFSSRLLSRFLFYGINKLLKDIEDVTTFTTVKHLSARQIKSIEFPLPPIPEQKRIVAILDEAFAGIATAVANTEKNLANARELFETYLNSVFRQRNGGWQERYFGELAEFKNGLNFTKNSNGECIRIVGVKDFKENYWVPVATLSTAQVDGQLAETYELEKNDILIVRSNGNKQLIGRCLLAGELAEKTSHSGFTIRARLFSNQLAPDFVAHFLRTSQAQNRLIESGDGASISSLNQKALASLPVRFPKRREQAAIVRKISEISAESKQLESIYQQKLTALAELKQSLLQKAFSGELTAEPEPLKEEDVA